MKYIESPQIYKPFNGEKSLFIAGGISGCEIWQDDFVKVLSDTDLILINPRRKDYDFKNPALEFEQIQWEYNHLQMVDATSFWFPPQTLCPIALFELGKKSVIDKPLFIGVHPDYLRKRDIEFQISLERPDVKIVHTLEDLAKQIKEWSH